MAQQVELGGVDVRIPRRREAGVGRPRVGIVRAAVAVRDEVRAPAPRALAAPLKARGRVEPPVQPVDIRIGAPVLEVLDQRVDHQRIGVVCVAVRDDES
jgi:hypothetical protein